MYNTQLLYTSAAPIFRGNLYPYLFDIGGILEADTEFSVLGSVVPGGGGFRRKPQVEIDMLNCVSAKNPYSCCIAAIGKWRRAQPASKLQTICDAKEMVYQDCIEASDNPRGCEQEVYGRYPGDPTRDDCVKNKEKWDREVGNKYNQYDQQCAALYLNNGGGGGGVGPATTA